MLKRELLNIYYQLILLNTQINIQYFNLILLDEWKCTCRESSLTLCFKRVRCLKKKKILVFGDEFLAQGLHLKSHQRCSAEIRICLSADQSSSSIIISLWSLSYTPRHCHVIIETSPVQTVAIKLEAHNYTQRCVKKARKIIRDSCRPSHELFSLIPSGRRYHSIRTRTSRTRDSFFSQAIRLLNSR